MKPNKPKDNDNSDKKISACILCSRNCGISVTSEAGRFTQIKGDPNHPTTKGYICQKAARLDYYQNHEERLTQPLKRNEDGSYTPVSWEQAVTEIAAKLNQIRADHGGEAFALVGGGGQGNHIGGAYAQQLRAAMGKSRNLYSALAQEKSMDFWMNGRLFGDQRIHCTEDVEHAEYVMFIGCNPYQAHGIPNARDTLKQIKKDPKRTMVVVDPRRSETANMADIHLQLKPGTDAYLMLTMLATIVQEDLHDQQFLEAHCADFELLEQALRDVPIESYAEIADVPLALVQQVARDFASASSACVRIDLGIQQSLHSTLTSYLEKMLYIVTGNFGRRGGNNLHTWLLPIIGNTDERKRTFKLTAHHKMMPIAGIYPPNILPDEIEHEGEDRIRAVWVDSCNPVVTFADSTAYERSFESLELLVTVDVALTETAKLSHYVLPAASQFEKWEATGFNIEFPDNFFHLRQPITQPKGDSLPEPEIYTRVLTAMGVIPKRFRLLERVALHETRFTDHQLYLTALKGALKLNKSWASYVPSILYRTLGPSLPKGAAAAALLLPLSVAYANKHTSAVRRAGIKGHRRVLGAKLFRRILNSESGLIISRHRFKDLWSFIRNKDKKIHLNVELALDELRALGDAKPPEDSEYPFILLAGERRSYNANQIYRNPAWRKIDKQGFLRMHPDDAKKHGFEQGETVRCRSDKGSLEVVVELDDTVREGVVTLPNGYGARYKDSDRIGPDLNRLTSGDHCDPFTKTPYHKYVLVSLEKIAQAVPMQKKVGVA